MRDELVTVRIEEGRELVDVPDAPRPEPDVPAPPRFLAPFDNAILAHADRSRIIAVEHRAAVSGDRLMRTFLLDGFVAGTWCLDGETLRLAPLAELPRRPHDDLAEEAERLVAFLVPEGSGTIAFSPAR